MLAFVGLLADYLIRYFQDKPFSTTSLRLKLFLGSISFAVLLILGRCAYRVAERKFAPHSASSFAMLLYADAR